MTKSKKKSAKKKTVKQNQIEHKDIVTSPGIWFKENYFY